MAKSPCCRWLIGAALVASVMPLIAVVPVVAQESSGRGGGDRGWRRNGDRPRGDGPRGRGREEQAANQPSDAKPAPAATTAPASTSFGTPATSQTEKTREWASGVMSMNDKDGNRILEGDEISTLGQSSRDSDLNGDGKITTDELVQNSLKKAQASTTATAKTSATTSGPSESSSTSSSTGAPAERKLVNEGRKSYRFKSTKERLPSWRFADRDKNGDGQVSMSEYSRSWSDRTAADFLRYDTDGDGMITSEEVR